MFYLIFIYMFCPCLYTFVLGALASSHSKDAETYGVLHHILVTVRFECCFLSMLGLFIYLYIYHIFIIHMLAFFLFFGFNDAKSSLGLV